MQAALRSIDLPEHLLGFFSILQASIMASFQKITFCSVLNYYHILHVHHQLSQKQKTEVRQFSCPYFLGSKHLQT